MAMYMESVLSRTGERRRAIDGKAFADVRGFIVRRSGAVNAGAGRSGRQRAGRCASIAVKRRAPTRSGRPALVAQETLIDWRHCGKITPP
jgi:hypothetical protein